MSATKSKPTYSRVIKRSETIAKTLLVLGLALLIALVLIATGAASISTCQRAAGSRGSSCGRRPAASVARWVSVHIPR